MSKELVTQGFGTFSTSAYLVGLGLLPRETATGPGLFFTIPDERPFYEIDRQIAMYTIPDNRPFYEFE